MFKTDLPVYQIWHNNREGQGEQAVVDDSEHYYHVVFRPEFMPEVDTLDGAVYRLLVDCIDGKSLLEVAEIHGEIVSTAIPTFIERRYVQLRNCDH